MIRKALLAATSALVLAGCVISSGTRYHIIDPYQFFNRSARGGLPVVIAGQPYPGRQAGVEAAVVAGFGATYSTFAKPVITPAASAVGDRLVILFNVPGRPLAQSICAGSATMGSGAGAAAGQTVYASAAFCGGAEPYSSAWIEFPNPGGPESPAFIEAMTTLVREAAPRDPDPTETRGRQDPTIP